MIIRTSVCTVLVLAGCGGGGGGTAETDASIPSEGNVTVTTYGGLLDDPGLKSGVDVIAIDPDGTARNAVTDADGTAAITVTEGGSIAAIYPDQFNDVDEVYVVLGVQDGDALTFGDEHAVQVGAALGTMTVTVPAIAGAQSYWVRGSCGMSNSSVQPTFTITGYAGCDATQDLYVSASNVDADLLGYAALPAVTFAAGGSITVDAWDPPTSLDFSVSGLSDQVLGLDFFAAADGGELALAQNLTPAAGSASATVTWAPVGTNGYAFLEMRSYEGEMHITDALAVDATSHTFDTPTLPWVTDVAADLAAPSISVTTDGAYAFDATMLALSFGHDFQGVRWSLTAPPVEDGVTTFTLPTLPPPFDVLSPAAGDQFGQVDATPIDFVADDGYDAVRERVMSDAFGPGTRTVHAYDFAQ